VQFYRCRFGTGSADFVIYRNCGVYIGATTMAPPRRAGSRAAPPTGPRRQSTA